MSGDTFVATGTGARPVIGPGLPPGVARVVASVSLTVIVVAAVATVPPVVSGAVAAVVIAVIGIPHGAVDHLVSEEISGHSLSRSAFVVRYLAAIAGVAAVWIVMPTVALSAFLAMSVHHFGQSDLARFPVLGRGRRFALFWTRGLVLVVVPVLAHVDDVSPTIRTLTGRDLTSSSLLVEQRWTFVVVLLCVHVATLATLLDRNVRGREIVFALIIGALLVVADPLLGFAVYFGLWHSLGHVYVLADRLGVVEHPVRSVARLAVPLSMLSLAGLVATTVALVAVDRAELVVPAAIIAVSMLTLPHMAVVEQMWSGDAPDVSPADRLARARMRR